jgi:hypothetical protein
LLPQVGLALRLFVIDTPLLCLMMKKLEDSAEHKELKGFKNFYQCKNDKEKEKIGF